MTSTALAARTAQPSAALAIRAGQTGWDDMQLAALAQLGIKDASDGDKAVFLHQCQRTGLDPFARQIYMIGRNEKKSEKRGNQWVDVWTVKWTIQTGIEGWRVIRGRAEKREGVRCKLGRAIWYDHDGNEHKVWVQQDPPAACEITLTVRDAGGDETPYTSVLQFREYVQLKDSRPIAQWATKPAHMLEKCTEADVYRKAFPQDFSGIYLDDAMPQPEPAPEAAARGRGRVTAGEILDSKPAAPMPPRPGDEEKTTPVSGDTARPDAAAGADAPGPGAAGSAPGDDEHRRLVGTCHAHFKRLGFTDDDKPERLWAAGKIAGVADLASLSDLDPGELSAVADTLAKCRDRKRLEEVLAAAGQDGGEPS